MPIYKRGKNRYTVRLYRAGTPKDWIVRGTRKQAETFENKRRLELEAAGPTEYRIAPGFSEFCLGRYRLAAEARLKAGTWRNRQYQIATLIEFFGQKPIDRITAADVEKFQHQQLQDVGAAKVNDDVKVLRRILRYAAEQSIPVRVPRIKSLPERAKKGRVKVWTADEVKLLYGALQVHAKDLVGIVAVMLNTGIRKGEALALEWSSVDLKRGLLCIYPSEEWQPKNGKPREIPIGRAALPWLEGERRHKRWVFPTTRKSETWGRWACWPQNRFDRARDEAGVGGSPHVCRHTFASHFLSRQPDLFLLAQVLGHSHSRVTALYAHLLPDHLERARDAVYLPVPLELVGRHGLDMVCHGNQRKQGQSGQ